LAALLIADPGQGMVQRVLPVKIGEEGDQRCVQHVAVEKEFQEGRREVHGEHDAEDRQPAGGELRLPDAWREQREGEAEAGKGDDVDEDKTPK